MAKYGVDTDAAGNPLLGGLRTDLTGLLGHDQPAKIAIDANPSKLFGNRKGPGLGCEIQPLTPLTNDYVGLKGEISALKANGYANILEGVAWGMRVLSPELPFTEGKPKATQIKKIMVVLTGGSNTFGNEQNELGSSYSSFGYRNAKADGVEIYTIRLEEPNVATGTMLKECASTPDNYFDVPSPRQLDDAFNKIKERPVQVRIAS